MICRKNMELYKTIHKIASSVVSKVPVKVKEGTVLGGEYILPNGNTYFAFKGIPYAQPPIGNLRFKDPQPLEKFPTDIFDCLKDGSMAFQRNIFTKQIDGSEDCLYLNVYTPKLNLQKHLPVMVWIHGGSYLYGSGNSDLFLPEYLLQEDVVVVTLNYRLGILGNLSLPEAGIGNASLKDQLLALKWINKNIEEFNGDKNNITLFGQSAGASNIMNHLLSEKSKKYFHKAICQSGSVCMPWAISRNVSNKSRLLAKLMGCKQPASDKEILEFLQQKEPTEMLNYMLKTMNKDEKRRDVALIFKPNSEEIQSDGFLTKNCSDLFKKPNSINVPVLMGYNSREGLNLLQFAMDNIHVLAKDLARMIPRTVDLDSNDSRCLDVENEIKNFYFNGHELKKEFINEIEKLVTDINYTTGTHLSAEIFARYHHNNPLYFYRFQYSGELNLAKKLTNYKHFEGACHSDELYYIFQSNGTFGISLNDSDKQMIRKMCRMWANFAKYSNPTPLMDDIIDFKWDPVKHIEPQNEFQLDYLEIDKDIRMDKNPDKERMDFWKAIYTKYNGSFLNQKF